MSGDNPGMQAAGNDAASKMAHEIETGMRSGNTDSAYQKWAQEVHQLTDPHARQAFVNAVQQQLTSKGYHADEFTLSKETPHAGGAQAPGRPRTEAPQQSSQRLDQPIDLRGNLRQSTSQTSQYETPMRGPLPPQTIQRSELPPLPQTGRQVQPGERTHQPGNQGNAAQTHEADRIAQGALQLKQQGADDKKLQEYFQKETGQVYKHHPDWMNANSPQSFIQELNRKVQQEHLWEKGAKPSASGERAPHGREQRTEQTEEGRRLGRHRVEHTGGEPRTEHPRVRTEHAHELLKNDEHSKLEKEGKIAAYEVPANSKHPRAQVPLRAMAEANLPEKDRTQSNIDARTKELAELNHLKPNSYFHPGDKLWMLTPKYYEKTEAPAEAPKSPAAPEQPKPAAPAPSTAEEHPAGQSRGSFDRHDEASTANPAAPPAEAPKPPSATNQPRPQTAEESAAAGRLAAAELQDLQLAAATKAEWHDATSTWNNLKPGWSSEADLKMLRDNVRLVDSNVTYGYDTDMGRVWTRVNLMRTLVDRGGDQNMTEAHKLSQEVDQIDPSYRQSYKPYADFVKKNDLLK